MSNNFIEKNIKLTLEFDKYVANNPQVLKSVPSGSCVVITVKGDDVFSKNSIKVAEKTKEKDQNCIEARKEGANWILRSLDVER